MKFLFIGIFALISEIIYSAPLTFISLTDEYNRFLQYCFSCMGGMNRSQLNECCSRSDYFCCIIKFSDRQRELCCSFVKRMQFKTQPSEVLASFIIVIVFVFSIFMCLESHNEVIPESR